MLIDVDGVLDDIDLISRYVEVILIRGDGWGPLSANLFLTSLSRWFPNYVDICHKDVVVMSFF